MAAVPGPGHAGRRARGDALREIGEVGIRHRPFRPCRTRTAYGFLGAGIVGHGRVPAASKFARVMGSRSQAGGGGRRGRSAQDIVEAAEARVDAYRLPVVTLQHELHPSPPGALSPRLRSRSRWTAKYRSRTAPQAAPAEPRRGGQGASRCHRRRPAPRCTQPKHGQDAEHPEQHHPGREHHTKPGRDRKRRERNPGEGKAHERPEPIRNEARNRVAVRRIHRVHIPAGQASQFWSSWAARERLSRICGSNAQ